MNGRAVAGKTSAIQQYIMFKFEKLHVTQISKQVEHRLSQHERVHVDKQE